jgi:hypothetical protein
MTMRERFEIGIFGVIMIVGLPAIIVAAQRISG